MPRRRRVTTADVRPEFPVVTTYVVTLLLFASFAAFALPRHMRPEGMIRIRLHQYQPSPPRPNPGDATAEFVVTVGCGPDGSIGRLTIRERDTGGAAEPIGSGVDHYRVEMKARRAALRKNPARVVLEIEEGVSHASYVRLLDIALQLGFEDVNAYPADPGKR